MTRISNLNSVSIKNYGPNYETLAVIKELKKLGIIKSVAKAKSRAKPKMIEDIKQDSDMVGYTKTLGPAGGAGFPLRLATGGMTQQQIEDINRVNAAGVAALKAEVEQQRLADIEAQQGQRFSDIERFGTILNPVLERFRGSTFPAQQVGGEPVDPFASRRPSAIALGSGEPEIEEKEFTETLNEGAPEYVPEISQTVFPVEEEETIKTGGGLFQPVERIRGARASGTVKKRDATAAKEGLGPVPPINKSTRPELEKYYRDLTDATAYPFKPEILGNKKAIFAEINDILDELALTPY